MTPDIVAQLAEDAARRFLRYVTFDTQSDADSESYPSTAKQLELLRALHDELTELGLEEVRIDDHGYVTGTLRATVEREVPTVAFFAHVDTAREVCGAGKVAFNPDEEIGRGVVHFPVDTFGAVAAYTVDGSTAGEVQSETFSGAQVRMRVHGRAIHPGWAKDEMVNAIKLAAAVIEK